VLPFLLQIAATKQQEKHLRSLVIDGKRMVGHVKLRAKTRALKIKEQVRAEKARVSQAKAALTKLDGKYQKLKGQPAAARSKTEQLIKSASSAQKQAAKLDGKLKKEKKEETAAEVHPRPPCYRV